MVVGVLRFELQMPFNQSLKEKRRILKKLKDRVYSQLKVQVQEVGHLDLWQRAQLGLSLVGNDSQVLESLLTRTMNFIVSLNLGEVGPEDRDLLYYE